MAQAGPSKGDRDANAELNLVPFIDLMSVLITFLLITAVWSQVSMIQIGSSIYGKQTAADTPPPPPKADIPLRVDVKSTGFRIIIGKETKNIPKLGADYDSKALLVELKKIKDNYSDKTDAVITVDDEVNYEFLILGMDMLIRGGFPSISVSTGGSV
jgi:biopolymer transport protein TolR